MSSNIVDINNGRDQRAFKQKEARVEALKEAFRASRESSTNNKKTSQSRMMDLINRNKNKNKKK